MFKLGTFELLVILFIILLLFGHKKLPELARALRKSLREFRKAGKELKGDIKETAKDIEDTLQDDKKS